MASSRALTSGILGGAAVAAAVCGVTLGYAQTDWSKAREAEFAAWQKVHPDVDAGISELKVRTAALVAAAGAPSNDLTAAPVIRRVPGAVTEIWDAAYAPQMVVIPAGSFTLGSPASEPYRVANEGPQRRVNINTPFAVGKYAVMRDEYAAFIAATKRPDGASCYTLGYTGFTLGNGFHQQVGATWRNPGFAQTGRDPVVCVSWSDAQAYAAWLSARTGKKYRLLSEAESEYAARAGTATPHYWGDAPSRDAANYGIAPPGAPPTGVAEGADRWVTTAPVGSFPPNAFGLFDMVGNASQWVQDCFQGGYATSAVGLPTECAARLARGASWAQPPNLTRTAWRYPAPGTQNRSALVGFRVARTL